MKASVIISIYKNTQALRVVLDSLKKQTEKDFEIIISEDGNHPEVSSFVASYPFLSPYQHLTQEDKGWQKNKALNKAIRAAQADWIIFIDGDCVLHSRFIEFHLKLAAKKNIVAGKRVKLNAELSQKLLSQPQYLEHIQQELLKHLFSFDKKKIGFIEEGIFISPNSFWGFIPRLRKMRQLKGCNMACSKEALYAINGFDEDYIRPAIGEDIDLTWRFEKAGYRLCSARNLAVQYHLHHKENWTNQDENIRLMNEKQKRNEFVCKNGINLQKP